ncbi:MAG: UDP-N-acetylglucosamine 2-epimerase (non-hydrolyzing) [Halobacteriovoraceae bacterium]|nr:UDP-N-acetylglucosamine 2-epimerase (non-hydrolyzing) [Halobacteriovoraceae bacterium]
MQKICITLGTRPEIIKLSPVIREFSRKEIDFFIVHSGQHYSANLDSLFFEELNLPKPKYNLQVGSGTHSYQTSNILSKIEPILIDEKPDVMVVQGDTNTVLSGALAASKLNINVSHVEAGLRSFDRKMPEEINRILTDHISDILFCPTEDSKINVLKEGIDQHKIFVTGNTVVDALYQNKQFSSKSKILEKLKVIEKGFFLSTIHRQENVVNKVRFKKIMNSLNSVSTYFDKKLIFPSHPRTKKLVNELNIDTSNIDIIEPLGYLDFLHLCSKAKLVFTDSGGIQEEACILQVPCITLRDSTERPETIDVGSNILSNISSEEIINNAKSFLSKNKRWTNPFGDGKSSEKIVEIISSQL